jgi:beta-glucanase (GH16 family)
MSGEIDIMESRGNRELLSGTKNVGVGQVSSTLHFGPKENVDAWRYAHLSKNDEQGFNNDFHTFKLIWTPQKLQFFVDGDAVGVFNANKGFYHRGNYTNSNYTNPWTASSSMMAPFDQEFYIILNLAVGGTGFFSDFFINKPFKKPVNNIKKYVINARVLFCNFSVA